VTNEVVHEAMVDGSTDEVQFARVVYVIVYFLLLPIVSNLAARRPSVIG
jgi:hypothetical protein